MKKEFISGINVKEEGDVASSLERMQRFVQEAKAASRLNHPNIAHIYEIGESDGVNFITMEFVEGVLS